MTTNPDLDHLRAALLELTPAQQVAVEALATGATQAEAAEAAAVARETVTRWSGHHPAFQAALNLQRAALNADQVDRVRRIRGKALAATEAQLDAGTLDPLAVLRAIPAPPLEATGPTDAAEILDSATRTTRHRLPPATVVRDEHGNVDTLTMLTDQLNGVGPTDDERADRLTIERTAAASGITGSQ